MGGVRTLPRGLTQGSFEAIQSQLNQFVSRTALGRVVGKQQIEPVSPFEYGSYLGAGTFSAEVDFGKGAFDSSFSQNL